MLKKWEDLPTFMRLNEVRPYWEALNKKRGRLLIKRIFDILAALIMLAILAVPILVLAALVKADSPGPVFYRQERVTAYGKHFRIHKFRTMVQNADQIGTAVTVDNDCRITRIGETLRRLRLDELPQVLDVLSGNMSFVGTRPEAVKYVEQYLPEYRATLLLSAGITSEASIRFKDESRLLANAENVDEAYMNTILPEKMKWNLEAIRNFSLLREFKIMFRSVIAVSEKEQ